MKKLTAMILALVMIFALAAAASADDTQVPNNAGKYRVIVADENGNKVKGAMVQFCSDVACMMGKTDANG